MEQTNSNDDVLKLLGIFAAVAIIYKIAMTVYQWGLGFLNKNPVIFYSSVTLFLGFLVGLIFIKLRKKYFLRKEEAAITNGTAEDSVFAGFDEINKKVFVNLSFRRMHTQVVGTTNAGKTESVIMPWIIDDIEKDRGLVFIDGKSDLQLLNKIYSYVVKSGREKDFKLISLSQVDKSDSYNPVIGTVVQVTEKIINSFQIENEYYRTVQFDILRNILEIFKEAGETPNFLKVRQVIANPADLQKLMTKVQNLQLTEWAVEFINTNKEKRRELVSGLVSNLGFFTASEFSSMFNTSNPTINITEAMNSHQIVFFQLPVLQSPILGKSVAKMVLQDIQNAVSTRHASSKPDHPFFSVYLDDFTEYLTPQFVSLLNKSRSANIGVVFAHQAIGDLEVLGPEIKNQILTNSNLKVFMRTNEPDSAEFFSKIVGTKQSHKVTFRQKEGFISNNVTGDGSIRDVEEFVYHPNIFKSELGLGEAVMILPHKKGTKTVKLKFSIRPNLPKVEIPNKPKYEPEALLASVLANNSAMESLASSAAGRG